MALTLYPEHLPQSGPRSKETQAEEGEGQTESGVLDVCTTACTHSLSRTNHTHKHTHKHTHTHKLAFRRGELREVKGIGKDGGS